MHDKLKVAGVQMDLEIMANEKNLEKILSRTRIAAGNGAKLIVFPECALSGYMFQSREEALPFMETIPGPSTKKLAACCRELGVYVIVGLLEKTDDQCFNVAVFIGPDGIIGRHRKKHLPFIGADRFIDHSKESFKVFKSPIGNIGIHICYEINFPEASRVMALQGADIIVLPTNWPDGRGHSSKYVVNARAFENKVHFVAVNRVGVERGSKFLGCSKIANSWGDTLAKAGKEEEKIIYAEVSLQEARQKHIVLKPGEFELDLTRDRCPELYSEITKPIKAE